MLAIERKNEILAILQKEQRVLVAELSQKYNVTEETIRRDLEKLEKEGFVKKTYGGAVLNSNTNLDLPLRIREKTNKKEKQIIAKIVAELIEEGETIMLDSSSTSLMVAKNLKQIRKLTVITNSVEVLIEFAGNKGINVISTGGMLRESSLSLVGKTAERTLMNFNVDKAVISCKGIDLDKGITESNESEAEIKSIMRKCAKTTILAIDNSKFDNISFIKVGDLNKNDIVITDKMLQDKWNQYFEEREIKVIAE
ncbi:DeoR family transcriptional regulator [Lachnotalea glycerini]|jgi:DeoR/GlpR family transcriptional regulator of sugar metabolism|uniref:DeoR family transcriptional regulator n=1 Tax=Lachnotalea glycerini TaxID=1763509 RepID=A0A255I2E6_9FIRM|nr:DeoR/GlpR family DNA-binding transcription regulator [Lachnotalea glycerini]PXV93685.1 DeoR family transcriptional regulator [Lachnotalea glycerini]RDY32631.1 DeoR/GlpR transcriptional regulator [Lachnotalea glycerini]